MPRRAGSTYSQSYAGAELGSALIENWTQPRIEAGPEKAGSGSAPTSVSWNYLEAGARPIWA